MWPEDGRRIAGVQAARARSLGVRYAGRYEAGMSLTIVPSTPPEVLVHDELSRCPYLAGRVARMPLRLPVRKLSRDELDQRLREGDRRQGFVLYRTLCPRCKACEPIRLDVSTFVPNRSQRRTYARASRVLRAEVGPVVVDARRVELYNAHKLGRGLGDGQPMIDAEGYRDFLVSTCAESFEVRYYAGDELIGVAVTDRGRKSLSAVYCHYDPRYEKLGIGTFSILRQLELAGSWGMTHLYLGLYIAESEHMAYKARFLPHERLIGGSWIRFDRPPAAPVPV
jgi:arginine-tRNA-protein transferase